jgi:hypothetical protein
MDMNELARKRSILFSARIQFSPETQAVRETAIDKIIEQNLLVADCAEGLTLREMEAQGATCFVGGSPMISLQDIEVSFQRLAEAGRLNVNAEQGQKRYSLSEQALQQLWEVQRSAEERFSRVVDRLFGNIAEEPSAYSTPFLECLCIIFSQLGETYVRLIKGEVSSDELLELPSVLRALEELTTRYPSIDHQLLEAAVFSFFQDSDPDYDAVKWNMAQNYYIAKALGLDPSGYLLSEEVFGNAVMYLDTNVVIHALEPRARLHRSFAALSRACDQLHVEVNVCQVSLDELRRVVEGRRDVVAKVADQIPDETASKVRGVFFELYREQQMLTGSVDLDTIFASFDSPTEDLRELYGVGLVDDLWFTEAETYADVQQLVDEVKRVYQERTGFPKHQNPALHDALLLRWIQLEREGTGRNTWLVTTDTSLPTLLPKGEHTPARPLAITLDALLQWISPLAMQDTVGTEIEAIFSEAVKHELLPQERFLDLKDFLVFAEMEWSCKELPAEDVEKCIRYLRVHAPDLDPSRPADREKLAYEISKFFADPGRKYKQELQRLEAEIAKREEQHRRETTELYEKIKELEKRDVEREETRRKEALSRSARARLGIAIALFLILEAAAVDIAWVYGEGTNFLQRVTDLWELPGTTLALSIVLSWLIIGKKRIRALGWPFTKLLKSD